jgi:hypothetical protein
MRQTPLTDMFLSNLECFTPEQIEKISNTDPECRIGARQKSKSGKILDTSDFRTSGLTLFITRNKTHN